MSALLPIIEAAINHNYRAERTDAALVAYLTAPDQIETMTAAFYEAGRPVHRWANLYPSERAASVEQMAAAVAALLGEATKP